jgi:hypothetical protein
VKFTAEICYPTVLVSGEVIYALLCAHVCVVAVLCWNVGGWCGDIKERRSCTNVCVVCQLHRIIQNMPYQAVVLPIVVGVGLAVAAVLYFISQGDSHTPHGNRPRNSGGTSHSHYSNSWEQG